jgi:hypothetical protein
VDRTTYYPDKRSDIDQKEVYQDKQKFNQQNKKDDLEMD